MLDTDHCGPALQNPDRTVEYTRDLLQFWVVANLTVLLHHFHNSEGVFHRFSVQYILSKELK